MNTASLTKLEQLTPLFKTKALSLAALAAELNVTQRHARRLVATNPTVRTAHNRLDNRVRDSVRELREEYPDRNCQWLTEMVSDQLGSPVSRSSVWRILKRAGLLERSVQPARIARSRFEASGCGDLVQMDTTWGYWWGGRKLCLILMLDDYSRYIVNGVFTEHDGFWENMVLIRDTVARLGTWKTLYTDNASFFKPVRHPGGRYSKKEPTEYVSEISRACHEVGIAHIAHKPYEPQGKGKIERIFRFIQERFVATLADDMTLYEINSYFDWWVANDYHEKHMNRTTGTTPKKRWNPEGFTPLLADRNLEDVFCRKDTRKVDSCNRFTYQGTTFEIPREYYLVAFRVTLHIQPNGTIRVWHDEKFICEARKIPTN